EVRLEGVDRAEELRHRSGELAVRLTTAVGGEVVPEDGVVDVSAEVERKVLLVQVHRGQVTALPCRLELLQGSVCTSDIRLVVLVVVKLHDLAGDVRLER